MKTFFLIAFATYCLLFAADYVSARRGATKEFCAAWLHHPWQIHLMMPGYGNACLDMGLGFGENK